MVATVGTPSRAGEVVERVEPNARRLAEAPRQGEVAAVAEVASSGRLQSGRESPYRSGRHENDDQPFAPFDNVVPGEPAGAFAGPPLADRQQPTKPRVGGTIVG